jgi:hypothetical protein
MAVLIFHLLSENRVRGIGWTITGTTSLFFTIVDVYYKVGGLEKVHEVIFPLVGVYCGLVILLFLLSAIDEGPANQRKINEEERAHIQALTSLSDEETQ